MFFANGKQNNIFRNNLRMIYNSKLLKFNKDIVINIRNPLLEMSPAMHTFLALELIN